MVLPVSGLLDTLIESFRWFGGPDERVKRRLAGGTAGQYSFVVVVGDAFHRGQAAAVRPVVQVPPVDGGA